MIWETPVNVASRVSHFTNIETLGFFRRDNVAPPSFDNCKWKIQEEYLQFDPLLSKLPPVSHAFVQTTHEAIENQIRLCDIPEHKVPDDMFQLLHWASDQLIDKYRYFGCSYSDIALEDVVWNFDASPGFNHDFRNKFDFLVSERPLIDRFWNLAHIEKYETLWKIAGKEELLPFKKIFTLDQRIFEIPDVLKLSYDSRIIQPFNKKLYSLSDHVDFSIKVGINFRNSGFHTFFSHLEDSYTIFGEGDLVKWDKNFHRDLRLFCKKIRLALYTGSLPDIKQRMDYIYDTELRPVLVTPWLQVLRFVIGTMCSGSSMTTTDNCMANDLLQTAYVKYNRPDLKSWREICRVFMQYLFSDDHVFGTNSGVLAALDTRARFYEKFGFKLKDSEDKVQTSVIGITFLGAKAVRLGSYICPQYNLARIWSSLVYTHGSADPHKYFSRVLALLYLSVFNGEIEFNRIRDYCIFLSHFNDRKLGLNWYSPDLEWGFPPGIPTYEFAVSIWLGWECGLTTSHPMSEKKSILFMNGSKLTNQKTPSQSVKRLATGAPGAIDKSLQNVSNNVQGSGSLLGALGQVPTGETDPAQCTTPDQIIDIEELGKCPKTSQTSIPTSPCRICNPQDAEAKGEVASEEEEEGTWLQLIRSSTCTKFRSVRNVLAGGSSIAARSQFDTDDVYTQMNDWKTANSPYTHTLLDPYNNYGIGIPSGAISSVKISMTKRIAFTADANGKAWFSWGVASKTDALVTDTVLYNVGFVGAEATTYSYYDLGDDTWNGGTSTQGCYSNGLVALNDNPFYTPTGLTNWDFPSDSFLTTNFTSLRMVSGAVTIYNTSPLIEAEGTMAGAYLPRLAFDNHAPIAQAENASIGAVRASSVPFFPNSVIVPLNKPGGLTALYFPSDPLTIAFSSTNVAGRVYTPLELPETLRPGFFVFAGVSMATKANGKGGNNGVSIPNSPGLNVQPSWNLGNCAHRFVVPSPVPGGTTSVYTPYLSKKGNAAKWFKKAARQVAPTVRMIDRLVTEWGPVAVKLAGKVL